VLGYVANNKVETAQAIHGGVVATTVGVLEGDRGAASDAITGLSQFVGGAAVARQLTVGTAIREGRVAATVVEGADGFSPRVRHDVDSEAGVGQIEHPVAMLPSPSALNPQTASVYSIKEARRLGGENRGAIFVQERTATSTSAAAFESGAPGAFSDMASGSRAAPSLRFDNPNPRGNNFVRFDGYENGGMTLIDRKTQLTTGTKQLADLRRVSDAAAQNLGYRVVYEFPSEKARASAQRILTSQRINNIESRVAPP